MANANALFGWDLLFASVEKDIQNNQDILVCLTHLVLVSNGFKCIGLGESKNLDGTENKSEGLPKGWNVDYAIRYVYEGRLYNFKGTALDDAVILNLIRVSERKSGVLQLNVRQVRQKSGTLQEMIPDNQTIVNQIKTQLIDTVTTSTKSRTSSTQTTDSDTTTTSTNRSTFDDPLRGSPGSINFPTPLHPYDYGRSDLDPFGIRPLGIGPAIVPDPRVGGGMLFQPPRGGLPGPSGLPPGSIPPGARFDPFRPPGGGGRPNLPRRPDNDEFPPPGYDDMFM